MLSITDKYRYFLYKIPILTDKYSQFYFFSFLRKGVREPPKHPPGYATAWGVVGVAMGVVKLLSVVCGGILVGWVL